MISTLRVALVQCNSATDKTANISAAKRLVLDAIEKGASFIALPEVFNFRGPRDLVAQNAEPIPGPTTRVFQDIAKNYNVFILLGSIVQRIEGQDKLLNTSVVIDDDGQIQTTYSKMHLFDVDVEGKPFRESDTFERGLRPVIANVKDISTGLAICYDLRFPELFRYYSANGVKMFCIPSSFTKPTGKAHWETLIRARAIENLAFVLAPDQTGFGQGGVPTFGNSMIVDPWGTVLARGSDDREEVLIADLDFYAQQVLRKQFPALGHRTEIR
ncbi:carbon-nitrogen hydrolase family protein [bacterium]|nr:carbon-nitrogen hydrolase family protein [bacterium]